MISGGYRFSNTSIAAVGLNAGDYVWSWGFSGSSDSLTLSVGKKSSNVSEPSVLALLGLGLIGMTIRRKHMFK